MADKKKRRGDFGELDYEEYEEEELGGRPAPSKKKSKGGKGGKGAQLLEPEPELEFIPEPEAVALVPETEEIAPENAEVGLPAVDEARFNIDLSWYDQRGLDFNAVARARFCPESTAKMGETTQERVPVVDPKTKRVSFEMREVRFGEKPLTVLRECCSGKRNYVTPDTPLMEAIFRVFLANGNQPMTIATLREHLLGYMPEMAALRSDYPPEMLERMIRADKRYGMKAQELAAV